MSSWLMRIILAYRMAPHSFCASEWPGKCVWNRDIDRCADEEIIDVLVERTGQPRHTVESMRLRSCEGTVFERLSDGGHAPWLLNVGVYHRLRRLHGQQYCPACLASDAKPHFRKYWRLVFHTVCPVHKIPLCDECPHCGMPVMFHRVPTDAEGLHVCHACGGSLADVVAKGGAGGIGRRARSVSNAG